VFVDWVVDLLCHLFSCRFCGRGCPACLTVEGGSRCLEGPCGSSRCWSGLSQRQGPIGGGCHCSGCCGGHWTTNRGVTRTF
jgi:hypothetical protein